MPVEVEVEAPELPLDLSSSGGSSVDMDPDSSASSRASSRASSSSSSSSSCSNISSMVSSDIDIDSEGPLALPLSPTEKRDKIYIASGISAVAWKKDCGKKIA